MSSPEELLASLDDQQRLAAETLNGPVCILAGAGTGKTRAITHRIAYGVATGAYTAGRVMALTFTAKAAGELRTRLRALGASGVAARTFHAAALSQLGYFWPLVSGGSSAPTVVGGKGRLLGQAAAQLRYAVDTATLRDVAAEIEWRKVSMLSMDDYAGRLAARNVPAGLDGERLLSLMQTYEELKDERRQFDFEDVLLACAGMIEVEPSVAMQVREQYRFFVVDEYQDVSPVQRRLLQLWLGERRDLCVVGDPSQTIYSFAGARSDFLLDFDRDFPGARLVRLERNYRSEPAVVDAANRLMRDRPGAVVLRCADAERSPARSEPPTVTAYPSDLAEARGVAQQISEQLARGASAGDIAVLYRVNVQSAVVETALTEAGIPFQVKGATRFFERPIVRQAVMSLRAASVSVRGEPLFKSVSDVLRSLGWSQQPPEGGGAARDRWDALNAVMGLVDEEEDGTSFRVFTDHLLERQAMQHEPAVDAVTLGTLHSAKGLEWDCVYLIGLSEGLVPIGYASGFDEVDEERRLLYVGITRARRMLRLSWSGSAPRRGSLNGSQRRSARQPSRFLAELGNRTVDAGDASAR